MLLRLGLRLGLGLEVVAADVMSLECCESWESRVEMGGFCYDDAVIDRSDFALRSIIGFSDEIVLGD